jgi:5-oxoprolinase (ATP-hydrolysing)
MIIDNTQTVVLTPGAQARILNSHIVVDLTIRTKIASSTLTVDPIQLSVFGHRFMSIAEQMGRALQKTCVSLNIKERLDFACAIFGPTGDLVANAPHVPIFLGSMSYAVKGQIELLQGNMKPGDVYATNHPGKIHLFFK